MLSLLRLTVYCSAELKSYSDSSVNPIPRINVANVLYDSANYRYVKPYTSLCCKFVFLLVHFLFYGVIALHLLSGSMYLVCTKTLS